MRGLGTLINILCILGGGLAGHLVGNRLKPGIQDTLMTMTGVGVVVLGMGGALSEMLQVTNGRLVTSGTFMMIISLAVGAIIGELLEIEEKIIRFGEWLKQKSKNEGDSQFVSSFVTASFTVCIGAMAVIGSIQDGISGDSSILVAKGILDAIIIFIMTASQGKGSIFSAIPVGILQGSITLVAIFTGDFFTPQASSNLSFVGSILILCVGLNLIRKEKIRVANALPAIIVAVLFGYF